ncbi:putative glycoside hydrolase [Cytobacillus sp. Hm23]
MKKVIFVAIFIIVSFITLYFPLSAKHKNALMNVEDYVIYYGHVNDKLVKELSSYDLIIIEPHQMTTEQVQTIKDSGTIVLGYISMMELATWNEDFVTKVQQDDYLIINNERVYVKDWDTYLMDISKPHYQRLLIDEIDIEIIQKNLDGIFIDTIGDIDDFFYDQPHIANKLRDSYVELLKTVNEQHSDLLLLQNWGFETFKEASKDYVHGIMWEDFDKRKLENSSWGQQWIAFFKDMKKNEKVAVFTVAPDNTGVKYSKQQQFVPFKNESSIYDEMN